MQELDSGNDRQELNPGNGIDLESGVSIERCCDYDSMFSVADPEDEAVVLADAEIRALAELAGYEVQKRGV